MKTTLPALRPLHLAALLTCLSAAQAHAADTAAAESKTALPEISVSATSTADTGERTEKSTSYKGRRSSTATGLSLTAAETPQAISTLTHQQLEDQGLSTVNDALDQAAGVTVERVETDRTYFTSRGFDVQNFQLDGFGLPFTNGAQWGDLDTAIYDHIDILRGANGLMTGTGLPSATVNFALKKPTAAFQASGAVTLGSWNKKRAEGDISGALNADASVRGRLVAAVEDKDSYLDRYHKRLSTVYGALDIDLTRDTTLSLSWIEQRSDADSPMWGALPMHYADGTSTNYDVSTSTAADWAWWNNTDRRLMAELSHDFGQGWQLKSAVSHRSQRTDSELLYIFGSPVSGTSTGLYAYPSLFQGRYQQDMATVQVTGPFSWLGRQHELSAGLTWGQESAREFSAYADYGSGAQYTDMSIDLSNWDGTFTKPDWNGNSDGSDFYSRRNTAYAAGRFALTDDVKLIAGGQVIQLSSHGENYGVGHAYSATRVTPYLGGVWTIQPDLSAYASFTTIFQPQTEINAQGTPLTPAHGTNAEVGLKANLFERRLGLNAALFQTKLKGLAGTSTWSSTLGAYVYPAEDATSKGIELEAVGRVMEGLELSGSYVHQSITDGDGDDTRTFVPRDLFKLSLRYDPTERWSTTAALRWQSEIHRTDYGVTTRQDAYALLDLGAQYKIDKHWRVGAQIRNVTDQKYINSLYWEQAYYGAPRSGEISVHYSY